MIVQDFWKSSSGSIVIVQAAASVAGCKCVKIVVVAFEDMHDAVAFLRVPAAAPNNLFADLKRLNPRVKQAQKLIYAVVLKQLHFPIFGGLQMRNNWQ